MQSYRKVEIGERMRKRFGLVPGSESGLLVRISTT